MTPTAPSGLPVALQDILPKMRTFGRFDGGRRLLALVALGKLAEREELARKRWQEVRNVTAHYGDAGRQRDALFETADLIEHKFPALGGVFTGALASDILHASGDLPGLVMAAHDLVERVDFVDDSTFGRWFDGAIDELSGGRHYGEVTTPRSLATLLVRLADPNQAQTILDPCCGLGSILARAQSRTANLNLFGQEVNSVAAAMARLRLFLLQAEGRIQVGDALRAPAVWPDGRRSFDRIICDPPFGQTSSALDEGPLRERFDDLPRRYEVLFLAHCLEQLKPDGRAIILMPFGFLFRQGREAALRHRLVSEGRLEGIIGLPGGTVSWTATPLAVVILRGEALATSGVTFLDASFLKNLGKGPVDRLSPDHIEHLARTYFSDDDDEMCVRIDRNLVLQGEVNLQPSRFIKSPIGDRPEPNQLMRVAREAEAEAAEALDRFDEILAKLNVQD